MKTKLAALSALVLLCAASVATANTPLSAPYPDPVYPEDVTTEGFTLRWMPVEGAAGYELSVTNEADGMEAAFSVDVSVPSGPDSESVVATVTGLSADTAYLVAVRALAPDPSDAYDDSDWSDPIRIETPLEDGLQRAVLLDEGFSGADNAWSQTSSKPRDSQTDCDSWLFSANCYNARSAVKVGGASAVGWALSPEITLSNEVASANIVLSFSAAAYPAKSTKFSVSIVDSTTGETNAIASLADLSPTALSSTSAPDLSGCSDYEVSIIAPTRFKLLFETISSASDKRLLLDSIKVTQVYDPNFAVLAAPTGVAGSDVGKYGFTVSWTGVANATGYEVWLDGASHGSCASTDTSMELTGLSDGTEYSVQVKALGDNLHVGDSLLSTAISVTTLADAQKIVFSVAGAPDGPVFAGSPVSFTVTAENEATHAAEPVAFSGIAGASFSNGTFSWTPTESDVGSHTATFASGTYSTNVAIAVRSATTESVLFFETFLNCATSWGATTPGAFSADFSDSNYVWSVTSAKRGYSGMRLGNKTTYDAAVTPTIHPANDAACTISLSFVAAGWDDGDRMTVSVPEASWTESIVLANAVDTAASTPLPTGDGYSFGPYAISVPGPFTVSFQRASGDGRMGIDSVKVTQRVSAALVDLDIPTGLAVVDGTLSTNSFSVAWNAVANASSYGVEVYEAGGTDPVRSLAPTATSAAFAGLSDDTDYEVRVRAQGDTSLYNYSDWTNLVVHTVRSALHPTLTVGAWQNACEAGKVYGVIENTATVSATLDDGTTPVAVALSGVNPAPGSAPVLADGTLTWTPDASDEGKPFVLTFAMTPAEGVVYTTNLSITVTALPALKAPTVTVDESSVTNADGKASGRAGLSWDSQYRATDYAVRAWTGSPNLAATATRVEEPFVNFHEGVRPVGWTFKCASTAYTDAGAPVKLEATGHWFGTFDLGGVVTNVSFRAGGHSAANGSSVLRVYGVGALSDEDFGDKDNWGEPLAEIAVSEFGTTDRDFSIPVDAALGVRRIAWQYTKDGGNVGVGSVVIEGKGFATPKFLPGWGPTPVSQGLVQSCTVTPTRAGRTNWAEVSVTDGTATYASVVKIDVPDANPVTLLILK